MMAAIYLCLYEISLSYKVFFTFKQHKKQMQKFRTCFLYLYLNEVLVNLSFYFRYYAITE